MTVSVQEYERNGVYPWVLDNSQVRKMDDFFTNYVLQRGQLYTWFGPWNAASFSMCFANDINVICSDEFGIDATAKARLSL